MKWSVRDITGERKRGHITKKLRSEFKDFWVLENPLRLFFKVWKSFHRKLEKEYVCVCVCIQQQPRLLQWQRQILNTLSHKRIPKEEIYIFKWSLRLQWRENELDGDTTGGKKPMWKVPVMAQGLTNPTKSHEVAGLIPGLAQGVKDPVLLWTVVWVADVAQIWHCYGSGVGQWLQLWLDPSPGNLHMPWVQPSKDKRTKNKNKGKKKRNSQMLCFNGKI